MEIGKSQVKLLSCRKIEDKMANKVEPAHDGVRMVREGDDDNVIENNNVHPDGKSADMEMKEARVVNGSGNDAQIQPKGLTRRSTLVDKRETEEFDWIARLLRPYSTFVVRYPYIIVAASIIIIALSAVLAIVESLGGKGIPDFGDPTKGYEARGTDVAIRRIAWGHLEDNKKLSHTHTVRKKRSVSVNLLGAALNDNFRFIYEAVNGGNMFDYMVDVCKWYKNNIMTQPNYSRYIFYVHHIPNYIALMSNKTECESITSSDVQQFKSLLKDCAGYYKNNSLKQCMENNRCTTISKRCKDHDVLQDRVVLLLYNVFQYLGDSKLKDNPDFLKLTASVSGLAISDPDYLYDIYKQKLTDLDDTKYGGIKVAAFNMDRLKSHVFNKKMITESALLIIAIVVVILLGWIFSGSLFLGLMTFGCIIAAMLIAWFVYNRVFDMPFFPFLNVTILIFIIGIGADDVFVYTGEWDQAKAIYKIYDYCSRIEYLIKWTTHTLRHATVAMFVTSLTTAAAFYANMSSNVIAVKCFGLFSGTAIICNYLLMITLFPACVIIHEKYFSACMHCCCPAICERLPVVHVHEQADNENEETERRKNLTQKCKESVARISDAFFDKYLPRYIYLLRYALVIIFFILGVVGVVVAFGDPGLTPPSTNTFQMFDSDSSLEQYELNFKRKFDAGVSGGELTDIAFVFGVKLKDNGYMYNPDDKGSLEFEKGELGISSNQIWLKNFCENIKSASFYVSSYTCNDIENFYKKMNDTCMGNSNECCNKVLPLTNKKEFNDCFRKLTQPSSGPWRGVFQPLYLSGTLKTLVIQVTTKYEKSSYVGNKRTVDAVDSWTSLQMKNASSSFKGWWMVTSGWIYFYDLQDSLYTGTGISLGIAIAVAFIVILITSLDVVLSIFSVIAILFVISITVGILVGDGWKLNIVESTVFSVAAGLSADFTMHYSIAYKESLFKGDRKKRVEDALSHIGPAMFMGAVTTFIGGIAIYPSAVLAYKQFGTFLMVVMFVSWLYSNFFFLPLCSILGPINNFGEINCCKKKQKTIQPPQNVQPNDGGETATT